MIRTTVFYNFNDTEIIIIMLYYLNNILIVSYYRKWSKRLWFDYTRFFSNIYIVIVEVLSKSILLRGVFLEPSHPRWNFFVRTFYMLKKAWQTSKMFWDNTLLGCFFESTFSFFRKDAHLLLCFCTDARFPQWVFAVKIS